MTKFLEQLNLSQNIFEFGKHVIFCLNLEKKFKCPDRLFLTLFLLQFSFLMPKSINSPSFLSHCVHKSPTQMQSSAPQTVNFNLDLPKSKRCLQKNWFGTDLEKILQISVCNLFQIHSKSDICNWVFGCLGEKRIMAGTQFIFSVLWKKCYCWFEKVKSLSSSRPLSAWPCSLLTNWLVASF